MGENQNKPSHLLSKDIHTKLSDILDFGSDKIKLASSSTSVSNTHERLKKLVQQLQELNRRVDRLSES
ncbi:MAG: hypothetical protein FJ116_11455 [Deltaproteobacteria bacterium]|nr:hypothetical protein [Deltaproteobacteria bacterium]MBM4318079.1 hypothetical protein [Deltaproteobacteria bacterium]